MLPMGVIYGSMTLKRYRKLEALHRKAHAALRAAFDTTGLQRCDPSVLLRRVNLLPRACS